MSEERLRVLQTGFRHFWRVPLGIGVGLVVVGAVVMALVYGQGAPHRWLVCGRPLFWGGVKEGRPIYVDVDEGEGGERVPVYLG